MIEIKRPNYKMIRTHFMGRNVPKLRSVLRNLSVTVLAMVFLSSGVMLSGCNFYNSEKNPEVFYSEKLTVLWEIWEILQDEFVEKDLLDPERLSLGAIAGMDAFSEEFNGTSGIHVYEPPRTVPAELSPIWKKWVSLSGWTKENGQSLDPDLLLHHVITGFLSELNDPYTQYIPPSNFKVAHSNLEGEYQGIGAEIYFRGTSFLINPLPNSPAASAGLAPGDVLISVNGENIEGWGLIELVSKVRGPEGTVVTLGIIRSNAAIPIEIEVKRGRITMESVYWSLTEDKIAYVKLRAFYANSDEALSAVLNEIQVRKARGIILDLRNNPGGYLETVSRITSEFLSDGLVAYEKGPDGKKKDWKIKGKGQALDIPLVIIVNGFSASASEVLTGALQDNGRATIVGTRTYGKGSVNRLKELSDGGALYYTYARWYTPKGRLIEGKGLDPDVIVTLEPDSFGDIPKNPTMEIPEPQTIFPSEEIVGIPDDLQWKSALDTLRNMIQNNVE